MKGITKKPVYGLDLNLSSGNSMTFKGIDFSKYNTPEYQEKFRLQREQEEKQRKEQYQPGKEMVGRLCGVVILKEEVQPGFWRVQGKISGYEYYIHDWGLQPLNTVVKKF